jgi:hypothetical protein
MRNLPGGRFCVFTLLVCFMLVFHGCGSTRSVVEFEVLEPATISFPDGVNQLLILNRAPLTMDVISEKNREGLDERDLVILDTLISNSTLRGLLHVIRSSPVKRFQYPFFLSARRQDTLFSKDLILTKREVSSLCERAEADAVISLEKYTMAAEEHYDFYNDEDGIGEVQNHYYIFSNRLKWAIYLPGMPRPFDEYSMVDTLYFSRIRDGVFTGTPSSAEMIRELFYESGMRYGRYLVPVWVSASRALYRGKGDSLRQASRYTNRGNWELAYAIWKQLAGSGDSTLAAKALHNMAVYYELEDNLDSASLLVDRALGYDSLEMVRSYREELDIRLMNRKEVIDQVIK